MQRFRWATRARSTWRHAKRSALNALISRRYQVGRSGFDRTASSSAPLSSRRTRSFSVSWDWESSESFFIFTNSTCTPSVNSAKIYKRSSFFHFIFNFSLFCVVSWGELYHCARARNMNQNKSINFDIGGRKNRCNNEESITCRCRLSCTHWTGRGLDVDRGLWKTCCIVADNSTILRWISSLSCGKFPVFWLWLSSPFYLSSLLIKH